MHRRIHFISGLPRSGSTVLFAPWRQNPCFHAGISGPVGGMFTAMLGEVSGHNAFSVFINDARCQRILRGLFANDYDGEADAEVVFDTHRTWCSELRALAAVYDFIVCALASVPSSGKPSCRRICSVVSRTT